MIVIVDNGGQYVHRIWRCLREIGVEGKIVKKYEEILKIDPGGIILSGGPSLESAKTSFEVLRKGPEVPILGICLGMQVMAVEFGGEVGPGSKREYGRVVIEIISDSPLFSGIPEEFVAWASHMDEVKKTPPGFEVIAKSEFCEIEAFQDLKRMMFGVQFHPEVHHTPRGKDILRNFCSLCL